ncbi:hypothetical protein K7H99_20785 (plasmid) [Providencia rettgeri]|uniref:hypothetical protein n=1 Tax=Providencia rettgeri TaxID=587 RepID=UPI001CA6E0C9|nr:hypothetical protein [Providencia rettgeri]QZY66640.1 hypothetical protein K7H99_20785 [Providencia rettgeri]
MNAAYVNGRLNTGGSYAQNAEDSYGTTNVGVDFNHAGRDNAVCVYAQRKGTRGDVALRLGHDSHFANGNFHYQGMMAVNSEGIALGQTSPSGSAMLVNTPALANGHYGFSVENYPVAGGGRYAVPVASYQNITFARAQGIDRQVDMDIRIPANIVRAHPGQVYSVNADVSMNLLYNGFLVTPQGQPVSGRIQETGDTVYPNGLFSIASTTLLKDIHVSDNQQHYLCDLSQPTAESRYLCVLN